ncbi:MAG: elongation factor Ts [Acidobacteria bacterium]|jgi:elongation factor Ts|nr:elongation factor Ts [Acidobacteriota bacterium]
MAITAKMVQDLREKTGVGMMDCKRALEEAGGNMDEAVTILRKKGIATAQKKAVRAASDGLIASLASGDGKSGVLLEVNCETDFVAKTDDFKGLVKELCEMALAKAPASPEALLSLPYGKDGAATVKDLVVAKIAKLGENLQLRRFARYEGDLVASYIHAGGKIGVLIDIACDAPLANKPETLELAKELCMQVAAAQPRFVRREEVTDEVLQKEREIYRAQVIAQGKPEAIADKIVEGKMNKFYEENCLLEQPFIKDQAIRVQKHVESLAGKNFMVKRFDRFVLGEGLASSACGE